MDENKEFLASENEEETQVNPDTDTIDSETSTDEFSGEFSEELAETLENQEFEPVEYNAETAVKTKKKSLIQLPIIISAVILVLVALGFLTFKCFFDTSIVGTWTVNTTATPDEATTGEEEEAVSYYIFESDKTAKIALGTMRMEGTYSVTTDAETGTRTVKIDIPSALQGDFEFEVSGNSFTGRKLVLTSSYYGQSIEFKSTSMTVPEMKVDKDFKPNDKLTGEWVYNDGYYNMKYTLNNDGTATVNQADVIFADGTYTYSDDKITIKYFTNTEVTMELEYKIDGEKLMINGIPYEKADAASSDEA